MRRSFSVREAVVSDADGIAKVHVDTWRTTYQGIMPDRVLAELSYTQRSKARREALEKNDPRSRCFVAEDDQKKIVGFVLSGPRREGPQEYSGEISAIYVYKEWHGQGVGKALFLKAVEWLFSNDHSSMLVWALKENPATLFYEAMGGRRIDENTIEIGGTRLAHVAYGWKDLRMFGFWTIGQSP